MDFLNSQWHSTLCVDSRTGGRAENQDCTASQDTPFGLLSVVCDGMGGGKAGRNASTLAAQAVLQYCKQAPAAKLPDVVLTEAVVYAQSVLRQNIKEHPDLLGMGTTCVAALVTQKKAAIVHVGDSRCYVLRDGQVAFRTQDHSVVGEMVRKGELTEEDARRAQGSNVITRALGIKETVEPETHFIDILPDDRIVLCTDGLWGHFAEAELVRMCSLPQPTNVLLPHIMDQAEHHGQQQPDGNYDTEYIHNHVLRFVQYPVKSGKPMQLKAGVIGTDEFSIPLKWTDKERWNRDNLQVVVFAFRGSDILNCTITNPK